MGFVECDAQQPAGAAWAEMSSEDEMTGSTCVPSAQSSDSPKDAAQKAAKTQWADIEDSDVEDDEGAPPRPTGRRGRQPRWSDVPCDEDMADLAKPSTPDGWAVVSKKSKQQAAKQSNDYAGKSLQQNEPFATRRGSGNRETAPAQVAARAAPVPVKQQQAAAPRSGAGGASAQWEKYTKEQAAASGWGRSNDTGHSPKAYSSAKQSHAGNASRGGSGADAWGSRHESWSRGDASQASRSNEAWHSKKNKDDTWGRPRGGSGGGGGGKGNSGPVRMDSSRLNW